MGSINLIRLFTVHLHWHCDLSPGPLGPEANVLTTVLCYTQSIFLKFIILSTVKPLLWFWPLWKIIISETFWDLLKTDKMFFFSLSSVNGYFRRSKPLKMGYIFNGQLDDVGPFFVSCEIMTKERKKELLVNNRVSLKRRIVPVSENLNAPVVNQANPVIRTRRNVGRRAFVLSRMEVARIYLQWKLLKNATS